MLDIEGVDPAELQFDPDHAHVQVDSLQFAGLVVQFRLLQHFKNAFEFFISQFHVLASLAVFLLGAETAGDVIQQAKLEVKILFRSSLCYCSVRTSVNLEGSVNLQKLVEHLVQLLSIARVRFHGVLEARQYRDHLSL